MKQRSRKRRMTVPIIIGLVLLTSGIAEAANLCFTSFGGTVRYVFDITDLTINHRVTNEMSGRVSGALVTCAGLSEWPIIGSAVINPAGTQAVLAFRSMTVDAAGCGAVDNIATLSMSTLSGPLQLHNDRVNFSNTDTLTNAACTAAFNKPLDPTGAGDAPASSTIPAGTRDAQGNANP